MNAFTRHAERLSLGLALLALGSASAASLSAGSQEQNEPQEEPERPTVEDLLEGTGMEGGMGGGTDTGGEQAELLQLFKDVELNLQRIDDFLFEAAAAEEDLSVRESGLAELLDETDRASAETVAAIDRILEISKNLAEQTPQQQQQQQDQQQQQQQQGQGQQQSEQQPENSPLDRPRPEAQQQDGQNQPEGPQPELEGEQPDPQERNGEQPKDSEQASDDPGQNQAGQATPDGTERAANAARFAEWGELPPRVQEIFSNQRGESLPVEYRGWIDNYYRRLARGDR